MEKSYIRAQKLKERRSLDKDIVIKNSEIITNIITNSKWFLDAKTIMIYVSFENEVDTHSIIEAALKLEKNVIVPVCTDDYNIIPVKIDSFLNLTQNKYGILEPVNVLPYLDEIDVVIVPGVAFDKNFNRVGFGKGYYDKFLSNHKDALKASICHDCQLTDEIYADEYDVKMDIIITEKGIYDRND